MTKIKICGLTRMEDIQAVNCWKPDYIGFVFSKSRRQVTDQRAQELKAWLRPDIRAVGVFVDEPAEREANLFMDGIIDVIQLHGRESEAHIRRVKELTGWKAEVIRVIRMETGENEELGCLDTAADYLLFDSGAGSGKSFDHERLKGLRLSKPFFLAGGIGLDNVEAAIRACGPYAVDLSSKVETDGYKDPKKIEEIIRRIRHE